MKKKTKKKYNPFQAYFGTMMSSISSPLDVYYGGTPLPIGTQGNPYSAFPTAPSNMSLPTMNGSEYVPSRELTPATIGNPAPLGEKGDPYKAFPKAPSQHPNPATPKKGGGMELPQINVKSLVGAALPFIDALTRDRSKKRTSPLLPLEVYNPYAYGTGSQAIMDEGGTIEGPDPINLHDMLTYTLANGKLPKTKGMAGLTNFYSKNKGILTDAQIWAQRADQTSLSPQERINSYFNRPVGDSPLDLQRAQLKSIGYGPVSTWENSPNIDIQAQLAKKENGGKLSSSKAREMLKDGKANGKKLTKKQKRYFGMVAAGKAESGAQIPEAFWGAIAGAVGGQAAGSAFGKIKEAVQQNTKNAAQAPQEIMNWLAQITAMSRMGQSDEMQQSPNLDPAQMRYMDDGGRIRGGDLDVLWGGGAQQISHNPYDGGTIQFNGSSHEGGGIGVAFGGKKVEVEGAETAVKDADGNLNIMGNMKVPGTSAKFKTVSKKIAEKEKEYDKIKTIGAALVNAYTPYDKWDRLKFTSGAAMMEGGDMGQIDLATKKIRLAEVQNSLLETAEEYNISPEALSEGKVRKAKKGTFMKAESGAKLDPGPKFKLLKEAALAKLKLLYPNSQVEVKEIGENRSIKEQRGLKSRGASKTSVSLHNLGGARDYLLYIDGKLVKDTNLYKEVIQAPAKELGLHSIGDWDPGHIGAVKEGKGTNPFATLLREHPDLKQKPQVAETISFLNELIRTRKADKQEIGAYNQLTGNNISLKDASLTPDYKASEQYLPKEQGEWFNQSLVPPDQPIWTPGTPTPQLKLPTVPLIYKEPTVPETVTPPDDLPPITPPVDRIIPSNAKGLSIGQILPELVALGQNQYEPVDLQQYTPLLEQPYQVSFQDRLNANTSTFRAIERQVQDSPTALSTLAGQQYQANQAVLADEFRFNQGEANRVYNANRNTLNDAQLKNLQLKDQQYVRQSTARSKTKAQTHEILSSLSNKYAQNRLNNQRLGVYENLYNYRFTDKNKDGLATEATNFNPDASFNFDLPGAPVPSTSPYTRVRQEKGPQGELKKTTLMTPSEMEQAIIQLRIQREKERRPFISIPKLFNTR